MSDLRKCEIQIRRSHDSNRENEKESEKEICYFHKWYDGVDKSMNLPTQFAIVELLKDGKILNINIENYNIRFLSSDESSKYDMDKALERLGLK